ncbi:MAG: MotA/TolQ/ExbB proton channel family protein [Steroidobacteraceae bacterium]|nr:MotA/TolQ/ExbB proton channel family protein [Steroidobacteraceae bacterium]MDW8258241.1 MotA/TolQ/ExbB proton channel family protein [Gammaproteobacteria bacterium]
MFKRGSNEFVFSLVALALSIAIVHSVYVLHIRPTAQAILAEQRAAAARDKNYVAERSIYVIIKDYEQEAEIVLMLWALALLAYKAMHQRRERAMLESGVLKLPEGMKILPEDSRDYSRQIDALPPEQRQLLLPRALSAALARFGATRNVQDVSTVARSVFQSEADRLDSELAMLRYIAWAIPAIGFIGTVRGIGDALSEAHKAVGGDISGVTEGLGVAFNSTLIALLLSIFLMFLLQQLQRVQESLVLDSETYLDQAIIRNMQAR